MSYFKRFTNFCGGFVAFAAILHLIGAYMSFEAIEAEGTLGKLKEFLDVKQDGNFRGYAIMALLFLLSAALGRIFERLPYVTLAVSLFPLYQTVELYSSGALVNFPSLYLILSIFHALGNIVYALALDRADGKRRAFVSAAVLGTMISYLLIAVIRIVDVRRFIKFKINWIVLVLNTIIILAQAILVTIEWKIYFVSAVAIILFAAINAKSVVLLLKAKGDKNEKG